MKNLLLILVSTLFIGGVFGMGAVPPPSQPDSCDEVEVCCEVED